MVDFIRKRARAIETIDSLINSNVRLSPPPSREPRPQEQTALRNLSGVRTIRSPSSLAWAQKRTPRKGRGKISSDCGANGGSGVRSARNHRFEDSHPSPLPPAAAALSRGEQGTICRGLPRIGKSLDILLGSRNVLLHYRDPITEFL